MLLATLVISSAASEGSPPLIDFDGTSFVTFGLFLVMLAVLNQFLFKPYLRMRVERDRRIGGAREEAKGAGERSAKIVADYEAEVQKAKQRGADERTKLRTEGAARERELLGKARAEGQKALDDARKKVVTDAQNARAKLDAEAAALAQQMVKKILGREVRG